MKMLLPILTSLIILVSGSKNLLVLADYHLNRDFYEAICENKGKPEIECHGKCQVQKKSSKENPSLNFERFQLEFYQFVSHDFIVVDSLELFILKSEISNFGNITLPEISFSVPNPPPVS